MASRLSVGTVHQLGLSRIAETCDGVGMTYTGGKGNCFRRIIGAMPRHTTYIETHLGGGAVMRNKRPVARQIGIDVDATVLSQWMSEPSHCELVHADAGQFLREFAFKGGELVYCDPPYPMDVRTKARCYRHEYDASDHESLLETLLALPCNVMISGGPSRMYLDRLADWHRIDFRAGARRGGRDEILWTNFAPATRLHDPIHRGENFREREKLKRRLATLTRRIETMAETERMVFGSWFRETYPQALDLEGAQ